MNTSAENLIKIGDAVLTPEAISLLTDLQDEDNHYLSRFRNILGDTAFAILKLSRDDSIDVKQEYSQLLSDIELVRTELCNLEKP
jgi:hypothetical protein